DEDKRVTLSYPTIVALGNADIGPVNAFLKQQRMQWDMLGFSCFSKQYLGFGYFQQEIGQSNGFDGDGNVEITHLTPRLLGYQEGASYFCGGAHPDNFITYRFVDVKTGRPVDAKKLLKGWVAKNSDGAEVDPATVENQDDLTWGPSADLVAYVN